VQKPSKKEYFKVLGERSVYNTNIHIYGYNNISNYNVGITSIKKLDDLKSGKVILYTDLRLMPNYSTTTEKLNKIKGILHGA